MVDKYKTEPCPTCESYLNRGVAAIVVVLNDHSQVLLVKRANDPFKGFWGLPGGFVEWDESVEDAAKRELLEETSLKAINLKLVKIYSLPSRSPNQTISVSFVADVKGESRAGDDASELGYFPINDLPKLAFDHNKMIEDATLLTNS